MNAPSDLYYLIEDQTWARPEADGIATVGISALGLQLAGDIYMCRPKPVGAQVEQGRPVGVVELAKAIVSVKSPVSGTVVETDPLVEAEPGRLHADAYGSGWLARLRLLDFDADKANLVTGDAVEAAMAHHASLNRTTPRARQPDPRMRAPRRRGAVHGPRLRPARAHACLLTS